MLTNFLKKNIYQKKQKNKIIYNRWKNYSTNKPCLVFSNEKGEIFCFEELESIGMESNEFKEISIDEWIPLPEGSELFSLKERIPVGMKNGKIIPLISNPYEKNSTICAVSAFISPAHTYLYTPAFIKNDKAPILPLFSYCAIGWYKNQFVVSAFRIDDNERQDYKHFDSKTIFLKLKKILKKFPNNRLIQHLGNQCAIEYGCACAKNYFMNRWEAPIPVSSKCNSKCIGCISLQEDRKDLPSSQNRIPFTPTISEIIEIAVPHLETAPEPIISFGQGCEGEPLLETFLIAEAITEIRKLTKKGIIHLNTNGTLPKKVELLRKSGLDSMRVSLNSVRKKYYNLYYRPAGPGLEHLKESMKIMKKLGGFVSINYLVFPGITDEEEEFNELCNFIEETKLDFIQMKNLNIDPSYYLEMIEYKPTGKKIGIKNMIFQLKNLYPTIQFGYFNPYIKKI